MLPLTAHTNALGSNLTHDDMWEVCSDCVLGDGFPRVPHHSELSGHTFAST